MNNKHFEFTDETITISHYYTLHRIRATRDIPAQCVKKGDLGGFVESYDNLSDDAWVYGDACVFEDARVCDSACVFDTARVFDKAYVYGDANVYNNARIGGNAYVGSTDDYIVFRKFHGKCLTWTRSNNMWNVNDWRIIKGNELVASAYKIGMERGERYAQLVRSVELMYKLKNDLYMYE